MTQSAKNPYPAPRQRPKPEEWNPYDEAVAFQRLREAGITSPQIAIIVGSSDRYVEKQITLLRLIPEAQAALRSGVLPRTKAYIIANRPVAVQKAALKTPSVSCRRFHQKIVLMAGA